MIVHDVARRAAQFRPTLLTTTGDGVRLRGSAIASMDGALVVQASAVGDGAHFTQAGTAGRQDLLIVAMHPSNALTRPLMVKAAMSSTT